MRFKGSFALSAGRLLLQAGTIGFGAFFVYVVAPAPSGSQATFFNTYVFSALLLVPAIVCLLRGFSSTDSRRVWLAIGLAILFWWGGDFYTWQVLGNPNNRPMPSIADALYLMFYPTVFVGIFALLRRLSDVPRTLWLQGVIAALSIAAIDAALVLESWSGDAADATAMATQLAYPMADLVLLMLVFGGRAVAGGQLGRAWNWLTGALVLLAVADSIYLLQSATGQYFAGGMLDVLWPGVMLLMAFAAMADDGAVERREVNRRWLTMPSVAFAAATIFLVVYDHFHAFGIQTLAPAVGALVFVVVDLALAQRDNLELLELTREESYVDPVTGMPNRKALIRDLERACATAAEHDPSVVVLHDLSGFKAYNDKFGHAAGDALLGRLGQNLLRVASGFGRAYRVSGDEFCVIAQIPAAQTQALARITAEALCEQGEEFHIGVHTGVAVIPTESRDAMSVLKLADQRLYAEKYSHTQVTPEESAAMVKLMQSRPTTSGRYTRLIEEAMRLAGSLMGFRPDEIDHVIQGFQLRDIGNCAVPDAILNKQGELAEHEWKVVRSHTVVGERILNSIPSMRPVAEIVRCHHERFDGNGYPDGLAGEAIPPGARLVAVAQAFEAMTSDRPFRPALSFREAVAELGREAGSHFDPRALAAFCQALDSLTSAVEQPEEAAAVGGKAAQPTGRAPAPTDGPVPEPGPTSAPEPRRAPAPASVSADEPVAMPVAAAVAPMSVIGAYAPATTRRSPAIFN